jgi:hypothetical protein
LIYRNYSIIAFCKLAARFAKGVVLTPDPACRFINRHKVALPDLGDTHPLPTGIFAVASLFVTIAAFVIRLDFQQVFRNSAQIVKASGSGGCSTEKEIVSS